MWDPGGLTLDGDRVAEVPFNNRFKLFKAAPGHRFSDQYSMKSIS